VSEVLPDGDKVEETVREGLGVTDPLRDGLRLRETVEEVQGELEGERELVSVRLPEGDSVEEGE